MKRKRAIEVALQGRARAGAGATATRGPGLCGRSTAVVAAMLWSLLGACGEAPEAPYACEVDERLLDLRIDCREDGQCPCGSHCEAGLCTSACRTDADCSDGTVCDFFGRCTDPDEAGLRARIDSTSRARLRVSPGFVSLDADEPRGAFSIVARGGAVGPVLVRASEGLQVQCGGGPPGAACRIETVVDGAPQAVRVSLEGEIDASADHGIDVFGPNGLVSVPVRLTVADATGGPKPLEGVYRGVATIEAFGTVARSVSLPVSPGLEALRFPVELTIHPERDGRRRVVLTDDLGALFPGARLVAEMRAGDDGALYIGHVAQRFIGGEREEGPDVAVTGASGPIARGESGLGFAWRMRFEGVLDEARAPYVDLRFALARTRDLDPEEEEPSLPSPYAVASATARAGAPLPLETAAAAALPPADALAGRARAEAYLCTPYGSPDPVAFGDDLGGWAGDLGCGPGNGAQLTFGLLDESPWRVAGTLAACTEDLGRLEAASPLADGGAGCVDVPRVVAALAAALEVDRRRALGEPLAADPAAAALAQRIAVQWLGLVAFVVRQSGQVQVLNDVLAAADRFDVDLSPSGRLALANSGLDLLLHPRLSIGLAALNPTALLTPDYRLHFAAGGDERDPAHDQGVPLSVAIAEALDAVGRVAEVSADRARFDAFERDAVAAEVSGLFRRSLVLEALAAGLVLRVRANAAEPPEWLDDWDAATVRLGRALGRARRAVSRMRDGGNPLGIDPELDLPWYRVGDQVSTGARFSALTDYFVGRPGTEGGIATEAVARAETALELARDALASNALRDFRQDVEEAATTRRLEAIRRRYGEQIASLCGDPDFDARTVLDEAADIDADTCFVRPRCRQSRVERAANRMPEEVAFDLCVAERVRRVLGRAAAGGLLGTGYDPADLAGLVDGVDRVVGHTVEGERAIVRFSSGTEVALDLRLLTFATEVPPPAALDADAVLAVQGECAAVAGRSAARRPTSSPATCALHGDCPVGYVCMVGSCVPRVEAADDTSCFTGALGEVAVAMRAAALDVEVARARLAERADAYDIAMRACIVSRLGAERQVQALEAHNETVRKLAAVKLAADVAGNAAEATKDCATAVDAIDDAVSFGAAGGVACAAAAVQQVAQSVSDGMQFAIDEAERSHEVTAARIAAETDYDRCVVEAEQELVGTETAALEIQVAVEELAGMLVTFDNLKVDVRAALAEGVDALAREQARAVRPLAIDYWLDERIEAFVSARRAARRAVFLAVLAVEYEYQMSSVERQAALGATRVAQLRGVLDRLRAFVATGTVSGGHPAEMHAVVSLRDNLLALADQRDLPRGWHRMTAEQRFRALLLDPRFAVYDEAGRYAGQEIPFRIVPSGAVGLGDAGGIPLLTGLDCAERLWSIGASLVGDGVLRDVDSARTRIVIRKRNRFFSQWCDPRAETAFQVRATRPSRNLLADPLGDDVGTGTGGAGSAWLDDVAEADAFTNARLQPLVGLTRADLDTMDSVPGASRELAGSGLYGEYTLFLPAEFLALEGRGGIDLAAVDDVLLRLDYVSVAR